MGAIIEAVVTPLLAVGAALAAGVLAWFAGRRSGTQAVEKKVLEKEIDAHDRINGADIGGGATDADRIKRLLNIGSGKWGD